jgi:hypothetical protein
MIAGLVVPAQAGNPVGFEPMNSAPRPVASAHVFEDFWIPAFAEMTNRGAVRSAAPIPLEIRESTSDSLRES